MINKRATTSLKNVLLYLKTYMYACLHLTNFKIYKCIPEYNLIYIYI